MAENERYFLLIFDKGFYRLAERSPVSRDRQVAKEPGEPVLINHEFGGISVHDGNILHFERSRRVSDPFYPLIDMIWRRRQSLAVLFPRKDSG